LSYLLGGKMLTINQQMRYLRNKNISVKSSQSRDLRNIGYYHGYKGYRFIRTPGQNISFSSLDEILVLNRFDMQLKSLFYPKVMFIENALKSYVIEALLLDSQSETFDSIFNKSITFYKSFSSGSNNYKREYTKRMQLKGKVNSALVRDYSHDKRIVTHFFNNDRAIPIWAIFESLTLGEFGTLYACSNIAVKRKTSTILRFPQNLDADGELTRYIIYTLKDLRNAIAHNNIIFDTRFQSGNINNRLKQLLEIEMGISNINFNTIDAYIALIVYILRKMNVTKTECKQFINQFIEYIDLLRSTLPVSTCNKILGTQVKNNVSQIRNFISNS